MRRDILTYLLFVLFAGIIWYGHAMQSERSTELPVLLHYTGKPGTIGLGDRLPDTVMIEVRDAGMRLMSYHEDVLNLTIDLRSYIHGEKGTIRIPSDALRRSISDLLQGSTSLIWTRPEEIVCPYFTEQERSVPVRFAGEVMLAGEYQAVGSPKLSKNKIRIYGQDKTLQSIDTIYTESRRIENVSDTVVEKMALVLPQGVRAERDSVEVRIISERYTEKKFLIPIQVSGVPEGYSIHLFPHDVEVSVRVGISHFAQVQANDIKVRCRYEPERVDKLDVEIQYSNPSITGAWVYPGTVEYLLEQ